MTRHLTGKIIVLIQAILSIMLLITVYRSDMLPQKYFIVLTAALAFLAVFNMLLQCLKSKIFILGVILSILISIACVVGTVAVNYVVQLMESVVGRSYQIDNMVVVVKADDPAEDLQDLANYRFGTQDSADTDNTDKMVEDIESNLGRDIKIQTYGNIQEEAEALLEGRVEAAIYNDAFSAVLEENIKDYASKVKVIYQYGVEKSVETQVTEDADVQKPFNLYISGIDVDGPITTTSRSDVNIIVTVNPKEHKILLTTTPRDYYVTIPGVSGDQRDKLTHAGIYGIETSVATLENLYNVDISYYVKVNFSSLVRIVDALGGVDVDSPYEFTTPYKKYHIQKGMNHLDGDMALGFARDRYSFASGDNQRGKNQEILLEAIINKAMSPAILKNMGSLISTLGDSVETNMGMDQMTQLINQQLLDGSSWTIESTAAVGVGDTQACYSSGSQPLYVMWPNENSVNTISEKIKELMKE